MPTPPAFLYPEAKEEWRRVAGELHRIGVLTAIDRTALAAYSQSYGRWKVAERAIAAMAAETNAQGLLVTTARGNPAQNPLVGIAHRAMRDCIYLAGEFGMTPSARSRLHGGAGADRTNPFAEFSE